MLYIAPAAKKESAASKAKATTAATEATKSAPVASSKKPAEMPAPEAQDKPIASA